MKKTFAFLTLALGLGFVQAEVVQMNEVPPGDDTNEMHLSTEYELTVTDISLAYDGWDEFGILQNPLLVIDLKGASPLTDLTLWIQRPGERVPHGSGTFHIPNDTTLVYGDGTRCLTKCGDSIRFISSAYHSANERLWFKGYYNDDHLFHLLAVSDTIHLIDYVEDQELKDIFVTSIESLREEDEARKIVVYGTDGRKCWSGCHAALGSILKTLPTGTYILVRKEKTQTITEKIYKR